MVKSNFAMCKSECEILKSNHEIRIFAISWFYAVIDRMTLLVELATVASTVVLSTFSPASFFSSTPVSSTKAPRVPEPSSRETTAPYWLNYFTGVPAPGGCWMVLTPAMIALALNSKWMPSPYLGIFMLLFVGTLMASRLPTISLKHLHVSKRALPFVLAGLLLLIALFVANFWLTLGVMGVGYVLTIPLSGACFVRSRAKYEATRPIAK